MIHIYVFPWPTFAYYPWGFLGGWWKRNKTRHIVKWGVRMGANMLLGAHGVVGGLCEERKMPSFVSVTAIEALPVASGRKDFQEEQGLCPT